MSYCSECGAKCNEVPTGKYSTETGEPITRLVCPTGACGHEGVPHDWRSRGLWGFLSSSMRCRACGKVVFLYD